ncbi:MAG: hypothetical protein U0325_15800 [Polyangiales bacterium]
MAHTVRARSQRLRFGLEGFVDGDVGELRRIRSLRATVRSATLAARRAPAQGVVSAEAVDVALAPVGPQVHHGASVEDLRAVLCALPGGVTEGLSRVQSGPIFEWPAGATPNAVTARDPIVGLAGYTHLLTGVYAPHAAFRYDAATCAITLPTFVCEAGHPDAALVALVLRHRTLSALVSAVSCHHERRLLPPRARRLGEGGDHAALRWHARADAWIRDVVGPWLAQTDPSGVARFAAFTRERGGVSLPLHLLETYDDLRQPGVVRYSTLEALSGLLRDRARGTDAGESLRSFAFWLHYDGLFDLSLASLARRTAADPDDRAALALRAHVLDHLGRSREALDAARAALAPSDGHPVDWAELAWQARANACRALGATGEADEAEVALAALRDARTATRAATAAVSALDD